MNGYYTWARYGFDGKLSKKMQGTAAQHGFKATRVSDLMKTKEGRDFWRKHGEWMDMSFNTGKRSNNSKDFEKYLKEQGIT